LTTAAAATATAASRRAGFRGYPGHDERADLQKTAT